jgi:23S rRNA (cytidine1920-2'-O)/16S rRNA (cytidine1409-2'-O)-methyltransferase
LKLEAALDAFKIDVAEKVVIDIGASTGGFTDCLLQRAARKVYCVDVGYGQLSWKLRHDPRVVVMERTNARTLTKEKFAESIDLAVIDVSFISAYKILDPLSKITEEAILLLKPQFEAGPDDVPKGGVIRDRATHEKVLRTFYNQITPWRIHGLIESPILGGSGNKEFLVHLLKAPGWTEEHYHSRIRELIS